MNKKSIILLILSLLFLAGAILYKTTPCEKVIVADNSELTIADYRIYFSREDSYLWSMEADGSNIKRTKLPGANWSEDGRYIVVRDKGIIYLYDSNTQQSKEIAKTYSDMSYDLYFNKSSTRLAVLSDCSSIYCRNKHGDDGNLWLFDMNGKELEHVNIAEDDLDKVYNGPTNTHSAMEQSLIVDHFPDSFKDGCARFYGDLSWTVVAEMFQKKYSETPELAGIFYNGKKIAPCAPTNFKGSSGCMFDARNILPDGKIVLKGPKYNNCGFSSSYIYIYDPIADSLYRLTSGYGAIWKYKTEAN